MEGSWLQGSDLGLKEQHPTQLAGHGGGIYLSQVFKSDERQKPGETPRQRSGKQIMHEYLPPLESTATITAQQKPRTSHPAPERNFHANQQR